MELIERSATAAFNADPHRFRLGVEAHRIKVAFAHDMGCRVEHSAAAASTRGGLRLLPARATYSFSARG